jgi:NaMN:DMB phosphoribosyltransferase
MKEALQAALLTARWVFPDQRIGQLLFNALSTAKPDMKNEDLHQVLFYMTDDALAEAVRAYAATGTEARLRANRRVS